MCNKSILLILLICLINFNNAFAQDSAKDKLKYKLYYNNNTTIGTCQYDQLNSKPFQMTEKIAYKDDFNKALGLLLSPRHSPEISEENILLKYINEEEIIQIIKEVFKKHTFDTQPMTDADKRIVKITTKWRLTSSNPNYMDAIRCFERLNNNNKMPYIIIYIEYFMYKNIIDCPNWLDENIDKGHIDSFENEIESIKKEIIDNIHDKASNNKIKK